MGSLNRKFLINKSGNKNALNNEIVDKNIMQPVQGTTFFHFHTACWQTKQFMKLKNNLTSGWVLQVMDFAKNRDTIYQDEIKASFYTTKQITLHPVVSYYTPPSGLVRDSCIVISEDCEHMSDDIPPQIYKLKTVIPEVININKRAVST